MSNANNKLEFFLKLNIRDFLTKFKAASREEKAAMAAMTGNATRGAKDLNRAFATLEMRPFKEVRREITLVEASYKRLAKSGKLSNKELAVVHDKAKKKVAELRGEMGGLGKTMGGLKSNVMGLIAAYATFQTLRTVVTALNDATKVYADFDDKIRQAGAVSNATAQEMVLLRDKAKEMGETTRFKASEAAEGLLYLGMAGFTVTQQLAALPDVLKLASAGTMDLGTSSDIVTNILTGYGMSVDDLNDVGNKLVATFTGSNTSLMELGYAFSYAGPVAKSAGQDFDETATILGLFANAGFKGERGGTALRGALSRLIRPTRLVKEAMADLQWEAVGANGKIKPMTQVIAELKEKMVGMKDAERAATIVKLFGIEAGPAMAAAIGTSADEIERLKNKIVESGGELDRVAGEMEDGIGGKLRELGAAWEGVQIAMGEAMEEGDIDFITTLTEALRENKDELVTMAVDLKKLVMVVGKAAIAAGEFVTEHWEVIKVVVEMTAAVWGVHKAFVAYRAITSSTMLAGVASQFLNIGSAAGLAKTGIGSLTKTNLLSWLTMGKTGANGLAAGLGRAGVAGAAVWGVFQIGKLVKVMYEAKQAKNMMEEADNRLAETEANLAVKLKKISEETGVQIRTGAELMKARRDGLIVLNEETGGWKKGTETVQEHIAALKDQASAHGESTTAIAATKDELDAFATAAEKAYDEAISKSKKYADQVQAIEEKLANLRSSTEDKIRAMGRKTMTDEQAWTDKRAQAQEKLAQATALAAKGGSDNLKEAAVLAKQSQDLFAGLQAEIKKSVNGKDEIVKSLEETSRVAISGYEEGSQALEEIYKKQQAEAEKSQKSWKEVAEGIKAELDALTEDREANVEITLENLQEIESKLNDLAKDREVVLKIREVETHSTGGMAGFQRRTGYLPGYGGGDRIPSFLEMGEFIIPKEKVQMYGLDFMESIRYGKLKFPGFNLGGAVSGVSLPPSDYAMSAGMFSPGSGQSTPQVLGHYTHDLNFQGAEQPVRVMTDKENAVALLREFERQGGAAS